MLDFIKSLFEGKHNYQTIDSDEFEQKLKESGKKILLDVRSKHEFDAEKIPNALNIDIMHPNFKSKVSNFDKKRSIYVYCQRGGRSTRACKQLDKLGFENIYNLKGGISNYDGRKV